MQARGLYASSVIHCFIRFQGESVAKEYPEVVDFLKALKIQDIEQGRGIY